MTTSHGEFTSDPLFLKLVHKIWIALGVNYSPRLTEQEYIDNELYEFEL